MLHLHNNYSFTESLVETVFQSLRHSCRSELHVCIHGFPWRRLYVHLIQSIEDFDSVDLIRAGVLWLAFDFLVPNSSFLIPHCN